jgi:predicted metalloprotease with PDZ domain
MILIDLGLTLALALKPGPIVTYTLTVNPADTTSISVAMVIQVPQSPVTRVAMAVHPEYNDRFWRYVRDLRAEAEGKPVAITAESDHSWRVATPGSRTTVTYRIQLPPENSTNRAAWHTTVRSNGASINSTDTFLYLPDFPQGLVGVALRIPENWRVLSGLSCTFTRIAPGTQDCAGVNSAATVNATTLLDSPILLGDLHTWSFQVQGIPHEIAYWPLPNATPFDTVAFVDAIKRYAQQVFALFGGAPYKRYTFLFEDGAYGGLEHRNSVSIGAPSGDLARDPRALMGEIAHEYFHTWNLMALNPRGILLATADTPSHTRELWWSEGVTMYYAETLQRRAGIPEGGKTRMQALQDQLDIFHGNVGNSYRSPEQGSWASIDPPTATTGDYIANYYTQGRLIGYALDRIIADSTGGRKGMDDVMRLIYTRYASKTAFKGTDIERAVHDVCECNVHRFFEDHVRNARPIDFNPLLAPLGLRVVLNSAPVSDTAGARYPDLRISAYAPPDGGRMRVRIMDPRTVWARAGVHTGMEFVSLNRIPIDSFPDFRRAVRSIHLGDVVPIELVNNGARMSLNVPVTGYERTRARVVEVGDATPAMIEQRRRWLAAK